MAIETSEAIYPVEFKLSLGSIKKRGNLLQLIAYSILLEEHFSKPSPIGFLVGKGKVLHKINIGKENRAIVFETIDSIRKMLNKGLKPESSATSIQCCACEYINFCNDRL